MISGLVRNTLLATALTLSLGAAHAGDSLMEVNQRDGTAYSEKFAKEDGVQKTASGLQYRVLKEGKADGKKPAASSRVKVNYEGRHVNGEVFDSSYQRNEPIVFPLNRVIPGWTEGVQLMSEGAKYQFVIPPELGYGATGAGDAIGPYETLVFDVELLEVQ